MSEMRKCDRCRECMELVSHRTEVTLEDKFQGVKSAEPKRFDLCLKCETAFYKFLQDKPSEKI